MDDIRMRSKRDLQKENTLVAKQCLPVPIRPLALKRLRELTQMYRFSLGHGDLLFLRTSWYVTHTGLLRLASRRHCQGIHVQAIPEFSDASNRRYVFKATVYKSSHGLGFVGYGDADPSNVSSLVHGAEMRVAETRAVNRALRKAYGIGVCSVEEMGANPEPISATSVETNKVPPQPANGNGGRAVRDRLCQLIRQHQLDPNLVKAYAMDFCGAKTLREASREQVENFATHLADWAERNRNALLCQLNSYVGQEKGVA